MGKKRRSEKKELRAAALPARSAGDPALIEWFGGGASASSGVVVTPETAMSCPPVYSAVRLVATTVGTLPLDLFRRTGPDSRERATDHPLHELLHDRPNGWMTAAEFRTALHTHNCLYGKAYARIIWNNAGMATALEPVHPSAVTPFRPPGGGLAFRWQPEDSAARILFPHEMLAIRRPPFKRNLIDTESPIDQHVETIGAAMATLEYLSRFFANNATPKSAIKVPATLGDEAAALLRKSWERRHQGLDNAHRIAILDGGMEVVPIGMTNDQAKTLEHYKELCAAIAAIYNVPLHLIGQVDKSTSWGTGIEQQAIGFITHCIRPELVLWEQALNATLLSSDGRREYYFEHNVDALLRGDFKSRMDGYALMIQWGLATPNEVRRLMNLPPLDGGDSRLQPLNMAPAEKIMDVLLKPQGAATRALAEAISRQEPGSGGPAQPPFPVGAPSAEERGKHNPDQPRDKKGRWASGGGFKVGRVNVDAVAQALGLRLPPGNAVVNAAVHRKLMTKHADDYEVCRGNLKRCLSRPDYVGRHPDQKHVGNIVLILKVKGLPKRQNHMLVALGATPSRKGAYPVASAFGMSDKTLGEWLASGHVKQVKKQRPG